MVDGGNLYVSLMMDNDHLGWTPGTSTRNAAPEIPLAHIPAQTHPNPYLILSPYPLHFYFLSVYPTFYPFTITSSSLPTPKPYLLPLPHPLPLQTPLPLLTLTLIPTSHPYTVRLPSQLTPPSTPLVFLLPSLTPHFTQNLPLYPLTSYPYPTPHFLSPVNPQPFPLPFLTLTQTPHH